MSQPPNQPHPEQPGSGSPWSGPYASGQPYSGQPHPDQSTQPYSGQPYPDQPTQPYSGQPYPGQPNPDVPSSVPPQPGYPPQPTYSQPSYPQPSYPQPSYPEYGQPDYTQYDYSQPGYPPQSGHPQQPGYPQAGLPQAGLPQAGYPQSAPPMTGYPVPPKPKSRALPITLVSIAVVLVLCVGGSTAVYLAGRNTADSLSDELASTSPNPRSTVTAEPTDETTAPASTITVVEPKTLGGRPKLTDPQFASAAEQLEAGLAGVPNATKTIGELYGTPEERDIVIVAAAAAPIDDPERELDGTFVGAGVGGLALTGITSANPGALGGAAKCGKGSASGTPLIMCAWADEGSAGWVIWYYTSMTKAKAEFPKLRAQVEKKSN